MVWTHIYIYTHTCDKPLSLAVLYGSFLLFYNDATNFLVILGMIFPIVFATWCFMCTMVWFFVFLNLSSIFGGHLAIVTHTYPIHGLCPPGMRIYCPLLGVTTRPWFFTVYVNKQGITALRRAPVFYDCVLRDWLHKQLYCIANHTLVLKYTFIYFISITLVHSLTEYMPTCRSDYYHSPICIFFNTPEDPSGRWKWLRWKSATERGNETGAPMFTLQLLRLPNSTEIHPKFISVFTK